ncbi:MAG: DUF362 domain-containing protein [Desulfobacteraceae bacterium]|jgi:uncharacterized protein
MSELTWVDNQGILFDNTVSHKIRRLADTTEATRDVSEGMRVALKINTAEQGYPYGLRPGFVRVLADIAWKATQKRPIICDGQRLVDYWKRSRGNNFLETAGEAGYTNETLGGHFSINGGFSGDEGELFPCGENSDLGGVEVGTAVCRSDALWVLSHVTLHPLFGISGALLNGGFDCLSGRARTRILDGLNPYLFNGQRISSEDRKEFQLRALESHCAVRTAMEDRVYYVNYLWDITPQPEYYPFSEAPILNNLGFVASHDPVALDAATYALIREHAPDAARIGNMNFEEVLGYAEKVGLGSLGESPEHLS